MWLAVGKTRGVIPLVRQGLLLKDSSGGKRGATREKVGLCIAGCGDYARVHARAAKSNRRLIDLYFASRYYDKAARYSHEYGGVGAFAGYRAAVQDPRVQATLFCAPHSLHHENLQLAAACGKHVLMEKPIATEVADTQAMKNTADRAGVHLMVVENFRYMPVVNTCADLLGRGTIGRLQGLHFQATKYQRPIGWRLSRSMMGGGALIDGGIHKLSVLRMLGGEPELVCAAAPPKVFPEMEGEEAVSLLIGLRGKAVGTLNYSWAAVGGPGKQSALVIGDKGHITFNFYGKTVKVESLGGAWTVRVGGDASGTGAMHKAFLNLITKGHPVLSSPQEASGDLALAAYRSIESGGRRIDLASGR